MARVLEISESLEGSTHVLGLTGRLDTSTSPQLDAVARRLFLDDLNADIVVDMEHCTFVSSAGLRVIVAMQKRSARFGSLTFRNLGSEVAALFHDMGLDRILTIE